MMITKPEDFKHCDDPSCDCHEIFEEAKVFWRDEVEPQLAALGKNSFTGAGANNMIKATISPKGYLEKLEIDSVLYGHPTNQLLPELLVQTVNDAFKKSDEEHLQVKTKVMEKMTAFVQKNTNRMSQLKNNVKIDTDELN